jgi:hypothetical protein
MRRATIQDLSHDNTKGWLQMADCPGMYHRLFHEQTQAIEGLEAITANLKRAQQDAEEMFIETPDPDFRLFDSSGKDD